MTREEAWRRTKGYLYDALSGEEADEIIKALEQEDVLDKIRAEIQGLRNCSCSCSDGIIDDVEDIIDKYRKMHIVIDIPKDVYIRLFDNGIQDNEIEVDDVCEMARAIRLGIPLPEGHGRLIDADEFHRTLEDMPIRDTDKWFNWLQKACIRLAEALTIIESDIESEE